MTHDLTKDVPNSGVEGIQYGLSPVFYLDEEEIEGVEIFGTNIKTWCVKMQKGETRIYKIK